MVKASGTFIALSFSLLSLLETKASAGNCYAFQNDSSYPIRLDFKYPDGPVGEGTPPNVTIPAKKRWPEKAWCWTDDNPYTAWVYPTGAGIPSWKGTLHLGSGPNVNPPGTYHFRDAAVPSGGGPCIANSYPGHETFCLVAADRAPPMNCGWGNRNGRNGGPYQIVHLKITCNNGRKWTLTCPEDGTKCNLNDVEFCVGLSQWNVGQHCTENGAAPNGHN
jgi:hypothetical protein